VIQRVTPLLDVWELLNILKNESDDGKSLHDVNLLIACVEIY
jgi:hypothetical protein